MQTGVLGIWVHKETKLSNQVALRTEIGMDASIWGGTFYPKTGFLITPVFRLEQDGIIILINEYLNRKKFTVIVVII